MRLLAARNTGFSIGILLLSCGGAGAQLSADRRPAFEVASVKPRNDFPNGYRRPIFTNGSFTATVPLIQLIAFACHLPLNPSPRLAGGPHWIRGADGFYDVKATGAIPDRLTASDRTQWQRQMLQELLRDRFRLSIHRQSVEMQVYALVVDKGGPKLQKSEVSEKDCLDTAADGQIPCRQVWGSPARGLHGQGVTVGDLVSYAENWTDRPIVDKTEIPGRFRIDAGPFITADLASATNPADTPTLFQVFESFGLKIRAQKDAVEIYTIDSIQRPTPN